ncbi:glycoside hydrolase family 25 protein [Undibacterium sp. Ji22W]|uniref:glycoside hydrolase family 25 protein n=1 Tax=Undibacterium sp. Ji22W TaxID=3413038 RepID=UPI003BF35705
MNTNTSNTLRGIDVSHFQSSVNWPAVKATGIAFAFAKASDGNTYTDPQFANNWRGMQAAGILRGAYHFYESKDDPQTQAQQFLKVVGQLGSNDMPPVVDIESNTGCFGTQSLASNLQIWLDAVEQSLQRTPIIYTNCGFWNANLNAQFSRYPLWIAQYGVAQPKIPNGWNRWTFWQSSESGSVAGITGAVDTDVFAGSMADLQALIVASQR